MTERLQALLQRVGARRAMLVGIGLALMLAIWSVARWGAQPTWVPLLSQPSLDLAGQVVPKLQESGIEYKLGQAGLQVLVRDQDLARARVQLAQDGLPAAGRPGFELFDQPSWGMTDFTQRINYRRALEGELERTIGKVQGIESAQVHLALQEDGLYRKSDHPAEASVVVQTRSGARPSRDVVEGIAFLVASSVDGLSSENVTVLDHTGRLLSKAEEPGSALGLTSRQLELRRDVENYLENKAEDLVSEVVGSGNVQVRVAATLNFDRLNRTTQAVDPDQQTVVREERTELKPGTDSAGAASGGSSVAYKTDYEATHRVETFSAGVGNVKRLTVAVLVNDATTGQGAAATQTPRSAQDLARVEALVRNALGLDDTRGDRISVVSVPFDAASAVPPPATPADHKGPDIWSILQMIQRPLIAVIALLVALGIGLQFARAMKPTPGTPLLAAAGKTRAVSAGRHGAEPGMSAAGEPRQLPERTIKDVAAERRNAVAEGIRESPEMASRVIRAWLREE